MIDVIDYFRNTLNTGARAASGQGNPSQDTASDMVFRGLGAAGRSAFTSGMFLKNGAIVTKPTLAIIGEAGPEAVVPLKKGGQMGKLSSKVRNALPKSSFGIPGERKYPMPDKSHARNAKARASMMEHEGRISKGTEQRIDRKANAMLHHGEHPTEKGHHNVVNPRTHHQKMRGA